MIAILPRGGEETPFIPKGIPSIRAIRLLRMRAPLRSLSVFRCWWGDSGLPRDP